MNDTSSSTGKTEIATSPILFEKEFAERKAYLEFSDDDVARLLSLHDRLSARREEFADAFYRHLFAYPQLQALLSEPATLARLKHSQSAYFSSLTAGKYDLEYVNERLRIGTAHHRIGLDPKWYIGAYRKYISELLPQIYELFQDDLSQLVPVYDALFKIISFDMGLALDSYFDADRREILAHKEYAEQVIRLLPAGLIVVDDRMCIRSVNPVMKRLLQSGESLPASGLLADLIPDASLLERAALVLKAPHGVNPVSIIVSFSGGEEPRHLEFQMTRAPLLGQSVLLLIAQDVTERINARADLRESEERFRLTFSLAGIGLLHLAPDGRLLRVNRKLSDILGYTEQELVGLYYQDLTHPEDVAADQAFSQRLLDDEIQSYAREKRLMHKDGHYVWSHNTVSLVRREDRSPRYLIVALEDISQRRAAADQLVRLAKFDALTQLPNRVLLQDRLVQAINLASRTRKSLAVIFLDLDRFKDINDSLGHDAGDLMLVEIARRVSSQLRESDTVARLGGDEFVVLLFDPQKEEHVATVARKILSALSQPLVIKGIEFFPTASLGISMFPQDGQDSQTLLKNADTAMYQAKEKGKNSFQFYSQEMNHGILNRLKIQSGLARAIGHNELALHYQPIIDTELKAIVGAEALLRWQPHGQPMVAPMDFIPIAEEAGLIVPIGQWVLREACMQARRWADQGFSPLSITINVSAKQFRQDIAAAVSSALLESGCNPSCITLELTESAVMEHPEVAEQTLRRLKQMGVKLAIDDFGTGHSSLNHLRRFPIDILKIDRAFVCDIAKTRDDGAIAKAIIALGKAMDMRVVAEGVETCEQIDFLRQEQCAVMQGFYFSKPLAVPDMTSMLRSGSPAAGASAF